MKELGKMVIVSAIVSCAVVIGGDFGRNRNDIKSLERRIAYLEPYNEVHAYMISWLTQFYDKFYPYEIIPETIEILDGERCEPCRNGWAPVERPCECKHKTIETSYYFLKKKAR